MWALLFEIAVKSSLKNPVSKDLFKRFCRTLTVVSS